MVALEAVPAPPRAVVYNWSRPIAAIKLGQFQQDQAAFDVFDLLETPARKAIYINNRHDPSIYTLIAAVSDMSSAPLLNLVIRRID